MQPLQRNDAIPALDVPRDDTRAPGSDDHGQLLTDDGAAGNILVEGSPLSGLLGKIVEFLHVVDLSLLNISHVFELDFNR
jgi:hypothetical protein